MASPNLKPIMLPETDMYQLACITYSLCVQVHNEYNQDYVTGNIRTNLSLGQPDLSPADADRIAKLLEERVKNMFNRTAPLPIEYDDTIEVEEQYCENCYEPIEHVLFRDEVFGYTYCSSQCRRRFME